MYCINFETTPILAPNCNDDSIITANFTLTDVNGLIGEVSVVGKLGDINTFDSHRPLRLLGGNGTTTQAQVLIIEEYPQSFEFFDSITTSLTVIDCKGIPSVTPSVTTLTINDTIAVDDDSIEIEVGQTLNIAPIIQANDLDNQGDTQIIIAVNGHNISNNQPTIINGFIIELTPEGALNFTPDSSTPLDTYTFNYTIQDSNLNPATDVGTFQLELIPEQIIAPPNTTDAVDDIAISIGENATGNIIPIILANDTDVENHNQYVTHIDNNELQVGTPIILNGVEFVKVNEATLNVTPQQGTGNTTKDFTYTIVDDGNPIATDTANFSLEIIEETIVSINRTDAIDDDPIEIEEGETINISPILLANDVDIDNQFIIEINGTTLELGTPIVINEVEFIKISETILNVTPQQGVLIETKNFNYTIVDDGNPIATDTANFSLIIKGVLNPAILTQTQIPEDNRVGTYNTHYVQDGNEVDLSSSSEAFYRDVFKIDGTTMFVLEANGGEDITQFVFSEFHNDISQDEIDLIVSTFTGEMTPSGYHFNDKIIHGIAVKNGLITTTMYDTGFDRKINREVTFSGLTRNVEASMLTYPYLTFTSSSNSITIPHISGGHIVMWGDTESTLIAETVFVSSTSHNYASLVESTIWGVIPIINLTNCSLIELDVTRMSDHLQALIADDNNLSILEVVDLSNLLRLYLRGNNFDQNTLAYQDLQTLKELVISNNNFSAINVSHLVNLSKLDVSGNPLNTLDTTTLENMNILNVNDTRITEVILYDSIKHLNIINNNLTGIQVDTILAQILNLDAIDPDGLYIYGNEAPTNLQVVADLQAQGWIVEHSS